MIRNKTPFETVVFPFRWPNGQWKAVIVVKANFHIEPEANAKLSAENADIFSSDQFYDQDINKSIQFASDLVPKKVNIDVAVQGNAYSRDGIPVGESTVSLRFGKIKKQLRVLGKRHWREGLILPSLSKPQVWSIRELRYEYTYGGQDLSRKKRFMQNPIGCGFKSWGTKEKNARVPSIFYKGDSVEAFNKKTRPAGFGFVGSDCSARTQYLGTYDEEWQKNYSPNLAEDFDFRYFNSVSEDQQLMIQNLQGQRVEIGNMHPDIAKLVFNIAPDYPLLVNSENHRYEMSLDTLCFMPDQLQYYAVWRTQLPIDGPDLSCLDGFFLKHVRL